MRKYRVPVLIDVELYEKYKAFADATGNSAAAVIRDALTRHTPAIHRTKIRELEEKQAKALLDSIRA